MIRDGLYRVVQYLLPPKAWRVPVLLTLGVLFGLAALIFHLSNASSYLSDEPEACINCHIMMPQYATWQRGSHGRVTTCNDCHVPHDNPVMKYLFKAKDGSRHAFMFTFRLEPQVIRVHEEGERVIQENCLRCHANLFTGLARNKSVSQNALQKTLPAMQMHNHEQRCWSCHRETPHGRVSSLSSVSSAARPELKSPVPAWVNDFLKAQHQLEQAPAPDTSQGAPGHHPLQPAGESPP